MAILRQENTPQNGEGGEWKPLSQGRVKRFPLATAFRLVVRNGGRQGVIVHPEPHTQTLLGEGEEPGYLVRFL